MAQIGFPLCLLSSTPVAKRFSHLYRFPVVFAQAEWVSGYAGGLTQMKQTTTLTSDLVTPGMKHKPTFSPQAPLTSLECDCVALTSHSATIV